MSATDSPQISEPFSEGNRGAARADAHSDAAGPTQKDKQEPAPLPPEVAPELASILLACLAKDEGDRPTAAAVVERLEASEIADDWTQRDAAAWWSEHAALLRRDESGDAAPKTIQVPLDTPWS